MGRIRAAGDRAPITAPIGAARWRVIKEILAQAEDRPPCDLGPWLEEACGGDPGLMRDVESFLVHEEQLEGFIERPVLDLTVDLGDGPGPAAVRLGAKEAKEAHESAEADLVGLRFGPYRTVRLLGEGGMGQVFLAERTEEFEQQVALKVVHRTLRDEHLLERFHTERQILARLAHPNIARLLDGGTTEEGAPYFAMELVDGEPIDRYCDRLGLSTRRRVELFLDVCSALTLAHQNLVIHRDLKPGNILVDTGGTPKLLDFGIAKILRDDDSTPAPESASRALTPLYASPEQLRGEMVGTPSDVYSLGVVLYKVLTGHLPRGLERSAPLEVMMAVAGEEPLPASVAAVGTTGDRTPESVSRVRDGDPSTLRRRLAGDLDAILARALRKDPAERYSSIEQLAGDLRRHLVGLPVRAREGETSYVLGRFVRRHRVAFASLAMILLVAAGFSVALVRQLRATEVSRDHAEEVSDFMVDLFQAAAPDRPAGPEPTVRQLLDRGQAKLAGGLEQSPEVRATLLLRLGEVYLKLGDYEAARSLFAESVEVRRTLHDEDHPQLATAISNLASVQYLTGDLAAAESGYRESLEMRRRLGDDDDLTKPMNNLAAILLARGKSDEAAVIYRMTLVRRRASVRAAPEERMTRVNLATGLRSLAMALLAAERPDEAEPLLLESLALRRELYGAGSPKVASVLVGLGRLEHARGRLEEADAWLVEALAIRRRELGDDHTETAAAQRVLADLRIDQGATSSAMVLLAEALATLHRTRADDDPSVLETEGLLAATRADAACLRDVIRRLEATSAPDARALRGLRRRLEEIETRKQPPCCADSAEGVRQIGAAQE